MTIEIATILLVVITTFMVIAIGIDIAIIKRRLRQLGTTTTSDFKEYSDEESN